MKHRRGIGWVCLSWAAICLLVACQRGEASPNVPLPTASRTFTAPTAQITITPTVALSVLPTPAPTSPAPLTPTAEPGHAILGDSAVRQALAYCTNKLDLARSVYPFLNAQEAQLLVTDSFVPKYHWAYAGDENINHYTFNSEKGQTLLDKAGWVLPAGGEVREKAGTPLALTLTVGDDTLAAGWADVWKRQMAVCGVKITPQTAAEDWFTRSASGLRARDFDMLGLSAGGMLDPADQHMDTCDMPARPAAQGDPQNITGWCNDRATQALQNAREALLTLDRQKWYEVAQEEFTTDVPALPLFTHLDWYAIASGWKIETLPVQGDLFNLERVDQWQSSGKNYIIFGVAHEPDSLYPHPADTAEGRLISRLLGFQSYSNSVYDFQPLMMPKLSTVENGLARSQDMDVHAGQRVSNWEGVITPLTAGVHVRDVNGAEKTFQSGTVKMKALIVQYPFREDLMWQGAYPVIQADYELAYLANCQNEFLPKKPAYCDLIGDIQFSANGYAITWLPGYQPSLYSIPPFTPYPSQQQIQTDGIYKNKPLAKVPFSEWGKLSDVTTKPWSCGPYIIFEWVKGQRIVFDPNPKFIAAGGAPGRRIMLTFVKPEDAVSQLVNGQVDVLGPDTITGYSAALKQAEDLGLVRTSLALTRSWEQIDFNLLSK